MLKRPLQSLNQSIRNYSSYPAALEQQKPVTIKKQSTLSTLSDLYLSQKPITVITAHDYITAKLADDCSNIDVVLIGDSLAMVAKGYPTTLEIPFDEYYYTCKSVLRGIQSKFVIADLPFGSFETGLSDCLRNSIKLMKLGKIGSLKLEGSFEYSAEVKRLTEIGIPVTGHLGLQPQKFNAMGGYKVQGKLSSDAINIYKQALHLQQLGCAMIVLECIPFKLAKYITDNLSIPTIGIGAGKHTSGQVLVQSDVLGMQNNKPNKFVRQYMNFYESGLHALESFGNDVKVGEFPVNKAHDFKMNDDEFNDFIEQAKFIKS